MRKTSKQLKEERGVIEGKIAELSKVEARTDAQNTELSGLFEQRESLTNAIEAELRLEKFEAEQAAAEARKASANGAGFDPKAAEKRELSKFSIGKTVLVASGAPEARDVDAGFEREVLGSLKEGQRSIALPTDVLDSLSQRAAEKRTMVTSTPTLGGNFIPTEKIGFYQALFNATVLRQLGVRFLEGLSANTDLTGFTASVTASWAANEIATQGFTNPTTAARELRPKLLSANSKVSKRLLIQTNPSIDIFLLENIMLAMQEKMEQGVINGSGGSGEPTGILSLITQTVALGQNGAAPSYAKILELIQTVESADGRAANRKFLINPKVKSKLKNTTIDSGSGAFVMGYNGLFQSQMGVIDGYDTLSTANVPSNLAKGSTTGGLSAMIFGDFSQVVVGQFGTVELVVDPYTNAENATIRYIVNQYMDSTVLQPNALGDIVDMVTT